MLICGLNRKLTIETFKRIKKIHNLLNEKKDKMLEGTHYTHYQHKLKHRKRYSKAGVKLISDRISIHERYFTIEIRKEFGHFEMDLIQNEKDSLQTLILLGKKVP